jgi:hypothetical protein
MRVTVTTSPGARCLSILRSSRRFVVRARDLLSVNPAAPFGAQLIKLAVERLSVDRQPVTKVLGQNREPRGLAVFAAAAIGDALDLLGLPANSPLSALAVEILPGPIRECPVRPRQRP